MNNEKPSKTGLEGIDKDRLPLDEYNQLINKGYMIISDELTASDIDDYKKKNKIGTKTVFSTDDGKRVETVITNCEVNMIRPGYYKGSLFVTIE